MTFLRGDEHLEYHADNFKKFVKEFDLKKIEYEGLILNSKTNVSIKCPGGGRVVHSSMCFLI